MWLLRLLGGECSSPSPPSLPPSPLLLSSSLTPSHYHSLFLVHHRNTKKCQSKIASQEKEVTTIEQSIDELKKVLTELEEEAKENIDKQEEVQVDTLQQTHR